MINCHGMIVALDSKEYNKAVNLSVRDECSKDTHHNKNNSNHTLCLLYLSKEMNKEQGVLNSGLR